MTRGRPLGFVESKCEIGDKEAVRNVCSLKHERQALKDRPCRPCTSKNAPSLPGGYQLTSCVSPRSPSRRKVTTYWCSLRCSPPSESPGASSVVVEDDEHLGRAISAAQCPLARPVAAASAAPSSVHVSWGIPKSSVMYVHILTEISLRLQQRYSIIILRATRKRGELRSTWSSPSSSSSSEVKGRSVDSPLPG